MQTVMMNSFLTYYKRGLGKGRKKFTFLFCQGTVI